MELGVPVDDSNTLEWHVPQKRYTEGKVDGTKNKPKEYPQLAETKTVAKHAMSEVCLLPRPSYSRGRAQNTF